MLGTPRVVPTNNARGDTVDCDICIMAVQVRSAIWTAEARGQEIYGHVAVSLERMGKVGGDVS